MKETGIIRGWCPKCQKVTNQNRIPELIIGDDGLKTVVHICCVECRTILNTYEESAHPEVGE